MKREKKKKKKKKFQVSFVRQSRKFYLAPPHAERLGGPMTEKSMRVLEGYKMPRRLVALSLERIIGGSLAPECPAKFLRTFYPPKGVCVYMYIYIYNTYKRLYKE